MSTWRSPWNAEGSLVSYSAWDPREPNPFQWRESDYTFWAALKLDRVERGRSAATFVWRNADKGTNSQATYPMFLTDMLDLLQHGQVVHGYTRQQWEVVKRGQNYGIARADA